MNIATIPAGRYMVAVSGGVDSVVLLHAMAQLPQVQLIIAHFDHGIRADSGRDAVFVRELAHRYKVPFELGRESLGMGASEERARQVRYAFLCRAATKNQAVLVTAHHQDDVLETAIINIVRGTGWRGLCSLRDTPAIRRPLLSSSKADILAYATQHHLAWREDSTNQDLGYLRNRVRLQIVPRMGSECRQEFLALIAQQGQGRTNVETYTQALLETMGVPAHPRDASITLPRTPLICLPAGVQAEIITACVTRLTGHYLTRPMLRRARWHIATARPHKVCQLYKNVELNVQKSTVVVRATLI